MAEGKGSMLRYFHLGWMRRDARLPASLRPYEVRHLIRVGNEKDGGYVVDAASIDHAEFLVSGGINDDWSFEAGVLARKAVPLFAFDASVSAAIFRMRAAKSSKRSASGLDFDILADEFDGFFSCSNQHVAKFIGCAKTETHIDVRHIMQNYPNSASRGFIKLDIEGSEYEILDQLAACAPQLTGLAIEFHDVPRHLNEIVDFCQALKLKICHVHINNWEPLNWQRVPRVIEISWSSYCGDRPAPHSLPNELDRPCCAVAPDFRLSFLRPDLGIPDKWM